MNNACLRQLLSWKLVVNIQEQKKIKNGIREVETKVEDFRIKYKNMEEIEKLSDLLYVVYIVNFYYHV